MSIFERTQLLLGTEDMKILSQSHIAVFGIGGVGGYVAEALVRSGVGHLTLIDNDVVSPSNLNRQLIALHSTIGLSKVAVMQARALDINPSVQITPWHCFFSHETRQQFDFSTFDYVVDAIDTVTSKILLIECCKQSNVPIISSMGAGNKLDPTAFVVSDLSKTSVCPLARVMRRELRKCGIEHLKVVYSTEQPIIPNGCVTTTGRRSTPGSVAFVPSVAGLILAGEVIKDLTKQAE